MSIAKRLRSLRASKALREGRRVPLQEVADLFGITRAAVSEWERGNAAPEFNRLVVLARFYDVTLDYLLAGENPTEAQLGIEQERPAYRSKPRPDDAGPRTRGRPKRVDMPVRSSGELVTPLCLPAEWLRKNLRKNTRIENLAMYTCSEPAAGFDAGDLLLIDRGSTRLVAGQAYVVVTMGAAGVRRMENFAASGLRGTRLAAEERRARRGVIGRVIWVWKGQST
jgi:transcriptional regulator with XRE-family HTH domain